MNWSDRRARFRAILGGPICVHPASVHEPVSARIAEDLGFECGMFAGSTGSLAVLGAPDLIVMTLTEFAQQALRINRAASTLPLMVDADHGYGNALNVKRTVEELETAGVSGLTIEDTLLPQAFGSAGKTQLIPIAEGVGKMRAALAGRQDPALTVVARTSAMQVAGEAETIARIKAYAETGVDAIFLVGLTTRAQLDAVSAVTSIPIMLGGTPPVLADREYLASRGVRIALQGHLPFAAAIRAIHDTLKALRDGTPPSEVPGIAPEALMKQVTRDNDYKTWIKEFLG
jgi:carboxyvinyl-carboxyphosphonate phosphorylmutase